MPILLSIFMKPVHRGKFWRSREVLKRMNTEIGWDNETSQYSLWRLMLHLDSSKKHTMQPWIGIILGEIEANSNLTKLKRRNWFCRKGRESESVHPKTASTPSPLSHSFPLLNFAWFLNKDQTWIVGVLKQNWVPNRGLVTQHTKISNRQQAPIL